MRTGTVSYKLEDLRKGVIIPIGMVGENDFTRVIFDAEEVFKKHPDAQVTMKVQPPKGVIYPATVSKDGNAVIWQVKAADVAHRGSGELQLTFTADTMVEKSYIARTDIKRSLAGNGPAPDPVQDWLDEAQEALEDIESAEVHQPIIGNDGYWYRWDAEAGEYVTTGTKAQGQDGHSPVLTSSKSGKTTTLYADGEQIAQIQDGEDGQGADVIDDTAGEGDTNKTWSADKLAEETGQLLTAIQGKYTKPQTGIPASDLNAILLENVDPAKIKGAVLNNLLNKDTMTIGYRLDVSTGGLVEYSGRAVSDFIPVIAGQNYISSTVSRQCWYDIDKQFISGEDAMLNTAAPANACYLRKEYGTSYITTASIFKANGLKAFENYSVILPWLQLYGNVTPYDVLCGSAYFENLFDKSTATDGKYVDHSTGRIDSNSSYFCSGFIPVKPSTEYKISNGNRYALYDIGKNYITGAKLSSSPATFTTTSDSAYVIVCNSPLTLKDTFMLAETVHYPVGYAPFGGVAPWIRSSIHRSKYEGKKMVCFGDSITNMDYTPTIETDTGIEAINVGLSSGRYAYSDDSNQYVNAFAFHHIVDSLVSGDWTIPDSINGASGYEGQYAMIQKMKAIDFSEIDFVSIAYGTNDFSSATPLENNSDKYDTNYFKGAMRYSLKKLLDEYPALQIVVVTPIYRFWTEGGSVVDDSDTHTIGGMVMKDYIDAIKEVCDEFHLPCCDNYNNAGINASNRLYYFNISDGLHPNSNGKALIGHRIGNTILKEY